MPGLFFKVPSAEHHERTKSVNGDHTTGLDDGEGKVNFKQVIDEFGRRVSHRPPRQAETRARESISSRAAAYLPVQRALCCSMLSLMMSIPALIGA